MPTVKEKKLLKPLTEEEKQAINWTIDMKKGPDDRHPTVVIETDYHGDIEKYLEDMDRHLRVRETIETEFGGDIERYLHDLIRLKL